MIKEIEYSPEAVNDLHGIEEYISIELDNSESAERIVDNIIDKSDSLSDLPEIGVPLSSCVDVKTDYRYLVRGNYNVFYRIEYDTLKIIRVLNARRNFMTVLFGMDC